MKPGQKVFIRPAPVVWGRCHPARQASRRDGCDDDEREKYRAGQGLGADVVIDYKTQDFEKVLSGYDLVLHSQDAKTLEKSLRVLKPGGFLVSISGARTNSPGNWIEPVPEAGDTAAEPWCAEEAQNLGVRYSFLFMRAQGSS